MNLRSAHAWPSIVGVTDLGAPGASMWMFSSARSSTTEVLLNVSFGTAAAEKAFGFGSQAAAALTAHMTE